MDQYVYWKKKIRLSAIFVLGLLLLALGSEPLQAQAVADTYLASERPSQNFGGDALYLGYNLAGTDNFGAQRILLRFDVDPFVPDTAVINSATLRLNLSFSSPADDTAMGTVVRRVASDWDEDIVTWNTEPTWTAVDST